MPPANDHMTLRDYARTFRQHRTVIIALTILGAAIALGLALSATTTYSAQASVQVEDPSEYYGAVGAAVAATQTQAQEASAEAEITNSAAVAARVKQQLGTSRSLSALENAVTATVDPTSNYVLVQATDHTAAGAAALANTFARDSVAITNGSAQAQFSNQARSLAVRIAGLGRSPGNAATILELQTERARFLSLANFAQPASVVQTAAVPSSPSSPKPAFDTLLGAVIGLILALIASFGRASVDRRLHDEQEIEQLLGYEVLGELREGALGRAPSRDDGLGRMSAADDEAIRIIRRNLDHLRSGTDATTVAVTSALPEEGKSTVAAAVAFTAAGIGRRTLLIEADLRRPVLAARFGLERQPGLVDFILGKASTEEIMQTVTPAESRNGSGPHGADDQHLACVVAGTSTNRADELLSSTAFQKLLTRAASEYDLVVLDCAPLLPVADTLEILSQVQTVVLCVRAHQTTRDQALAAKRAIMKFAPRPLGVVVTAASETDGYGSYAYTYAYKSSAD